MFYSPISFTYCQFKIILLWGPRGPQHFFVRLCSSLTFLCGTCDVNQGARVVKALTEKWLRSGQNIVSDNFFTSVPLAEDMFAQNMTLVGTIRKNKADVPAKMTTAQGREERSSTYGFCDNLTLVSYVPKKGKVVTLLSSMHHDTRVEGDDKKPHIIQHYNACKGGVDVMDKLATTYSCRRKINRWPMTLYFNTVDVSCIAALVIWILNHPREKRHKQKFRRLFLASLGQQLVEDHIQQRLQNPRAVQRTPGRHWNVLAT